MQTESTRTNGFKSSTHGHDETKQPEGMVAQAIEKQTAKIPSDVFLWAAGASIVASVALQTVGMMNERQPSFFRPRANRFRAPLSSFVAHWAPTLLMLGLYNKIVKVAGSDRVSH